MLSIQDFQGIKDLPIEADVETAFAEMEVKDSKVMLYPYFDRGMKKVFPAVILAVSVARVAAISKAVSNHVVLFGYTSDETNVEGRFFVACGDKFLDGSLPKTQAWDLVNEAVAASGNAALKSEFMEGYEFASLNARCAFWSNWGRDKSVCVHTRYVLSKINISQIEALKTVFHERFEIKDSQSLLDESEMEFINKYAFKVPIMWEGDRGSGKTVGARYFAESGNYIYIEIAGNQGIEATDILGYNVPYGAGQMVWKDGRMSQAFRLAAKGIPVVLCFDEIARIPIHHLSVILSALAPYKGRYYLQTGRMLGVEDGVGVEETLVCDVDKLCVFSTTNVGSSYAVHEMDPAIMERFVLVRKDTTRDKLEKILTKECGARRFSVALVQRLLGFYDAMLKLKSMGSLNLTPTTRTMVRAIQTAADETDVKQGLLDQMLLWVDRDIDGFPVKEQISQVVAVVNSKL